MTTSVTKLYFTTQHKTCETKTKTIACKTKAKTNVFRLRQVLLRPTVSNNIIGFSHGKLEALCSQALTPMGGTTI